jgi:hypothetical protein
LFHEPAGVTARPRRSRSAIARAAALAVFAALAPAVLAQVAAPAAHAAPTSTVTLRVESARDGGGHTAGEAILEYKYLITRQDSGNPGQPRDPDCMPNGTDSATDYPKTCDWPSVRKMTGGAGGAENLIAQGDQSTLDEATGLDLPDGDYLISVIADTYKIDGLHFSVPLEEPGLLTVRMNPDPHPFTTVMIQVFEDSLTNGQYDPQSDRPLPGFTGHIDDVVGEVTTDWYGNPLCAEYDGNGDYIEGTGGACLSDANGIITIPNIGPNRYEVTVTAPDGQEWAQTTTLEGGHGWDAWAFEGWDGRDNELLINGAPIPWVQAGFVQPTPVSGGTGHVVGSVISVKSYLPPAGGDTDEGPIDRPWLAVTDLLGNDSLVYAGRGNADGTFDIGGLPAGDYQLTYWDNDQNLLLQTRKVVVGAGETVDVGPLRLSHWFSELHGTVFIDTNENGKRDGGEAPLKGQPVVLKSRDNSLVEQGSRAVVTDANGNYVLKQVYPYGYWTVLEVYNDRFFTTGMTYQADNQLEETTVLGAGVDVATLNQDGLNARVDWGVLPYAPGTNGGIVGTVVYNMTRNELDARLAATEDYEPGIPNLTVNLYRPVDVNPVDGEYDTDPDGSLTRGPKIGEATTETFERPTDCQARDAAGNPLDLPFAPPATGGFECVESPLMGNQVQTGFSTVNGNYGFGTVWRLDEAGEPVRDGNGDIIEDPMPPGDYLVSVEAPNDAFGTPTYKVSREEDINVFDGSDFEPQVPPPPCAGALHTVDVAGIGADGPNATVNPAFADVGGSPYEGEDRPLCDTRLITVSDQRSIAPLFSFFTDVPQPGRLFGAVVEDLMLGTDPKEFYYGEKAGIPNAAIGVYDYTGRQVLSTQADANGFFDILLPSTNTFNCPLPAGPCPNMYRVVGNDPGTPDHPNPSYDPQYRTFATWWQIWPGLSLLADVALLQTGNVLEQPGTTGTHPAACLQPEGQPQLFATDQVLGQPGTSFTIEGDHFGASQGVGSVNLDGTALTVDAWSDRSIEVTVPAGTPPGPHQLVITGDSGLEATNTVTFHVIGGGYAPTVFEVGPGQTYATVQAGIDAAASSGEALVLVHPGTPRTHFPLGDYFENVVINSPVKLQGFGPGGVRTDGSSVRGSILNGTGFATTRATAWSDLVETIKAGPGWDGNQEVYDGQVVYVVARDGEFTAGYQASIDGFSIEGGNEFGNEGTFVTSPYVTQGGGIFVNAYARHLQITNNVLRSNGGSFGGGIRVGTPYVGDNHNDDLRIAHNRVIANGGSNLAGGIGLFVGTNGYEIDNNDICGNFSAEYGGGISHFGLSGVGNPGRIHDNQVWANGSYDEGAGIMIAGEDTATTGNQVSPGSGPVAIDANLIQANLAEDDGGGLRFLQSGTFPMNVTNNAIVNNVSAHEGGGVALDDATNVRLVNNTVMKNITTATAATSDGNPAPAGLSSGANSDLLQATLPPGAKTWSDPLQFNNVFWDNRAGSYDFQANHLTGIGLPGDPDDPNVWDMGLLDQTGKLSPTTSILTRDDPTYVNPSAGNKVGVDPQVVNSYDTVVRTLPWRGNTQTVVTITVSLDLPPTVLGDYHLTAGSPAENSGASLQAGVAAPGHDIDNDGRPSGTGVEIGADEFPGAPAPDTTGPITTDQAITPNPTNNVGTVTLTATADDSTTGGTAIAEAEWFTGADPGLGNGNAMVASDGTFDTAIEGVRATTGLNGFPNGDTVVQLRSRDAANNWGPVVSVTLHVDTGPPNLSPLTLTPSTVVQDSTATLTGSASDTGAGNGVAGAEWFEGADPGQGNGTPMSAVDGSFGGSPEALTAIVNTSSMTPGTHTLRARARDTAGSWSQLRSVTLTVRSQLIFANGFESGNTSAWSSVNGPTRIAVLAAAAMRSTSFGLRVQLGSGATYVEDASPTNENVYNARFWFDPNDSITNGHGILQTVAGGNQRFVVDYRHAAAANPYEVRLRVFANGGTTVSSAWVAIPNGPDAYEVAWAAGAGSTTRLYRGGSQIAAVVANTNGQLIQTARLGATSSPGPSSSGFEFFDEFYSTRGIPVGP